LNGSSRYIGFYQRDSTALGYIRVISGGVEILNVSDRRLKKNIVSTRKNALEILNRLEVVDYQWKEGDGSTITGYVAQDALEAYPEMVYYDEAEDLYTISKAQLIPVLHKAINEQQKLIEKQQKQIEILMERLEKVEGK